MEIKWKQKKVRMVKDGERLAKIKIHTTIHRKWFHPSPQKTPIFSWRLFTQEELTKISRFSHLKKIISKKKKLGLYHRF